MLPQYPNPMRTRGWVAALALVGGCSVIAIATAQQLPLSQDEARNLARSRDLDSLRRANTAKTATGQPLLLNPGKVPLPSNLKNYLNPSIGFAEARLAAAQLGKALFWDQAIGSDGQACASCHYHAGADPRSKNQLNPDLKRIANQRDGDIKGFHNAPAQPDFGLSFARGANYQLQANDWPFVKDIGLGNANGANVALNLDPVSPNTNDTAASQGVFYTAYEGVCEVSSNCTDNPNVFSRGALGSIPVELRDKGTPVSDPAALFQLPTSADDGAFAGKANVRRVEPRNTPSMINAVFNLHNFWDGRANFVFNGVSPFGQMDTGAKVFFRTSSGNLQSRRLNMSPASLASQAVGPGLSDFEMSFAGRSWPDVGRKMLHRCLLESQEVASDDSLLANLKSVGTCRAGKGLSSTYEALIKKAFDPIYWQANYSVVMTKKSVRNLHPNDPFFDQGAVQFMDTALAQSAIAKGTLKKNQVANLMEANFSFFFGVAVMLYEAELVADHSKFDRFMEATATLSDEELFGLQVFAGKGNCANCHGGPELSKATVRHTQSGQDLIEPMIMGDNRVAIYDNGFYNIGVTPTVEDVGRGGQGPNNVPLASSRQFLFAKNSIQPIPFDILGAPIVGLQPQTPMFDSLGNCLQPILLRSEAGAPPVAVGQDLNCDGKINLNDNILIPRVAVDGAFKTPMLRNVELTGPYGHNGGLLTLRDVVEFYNRGGNFCKFNLHDLDPDIQSLDLSEAEKDGLVAFLLTLTDERVRNQAAPFDHPELRIPNGHTGDDKHAAGDTSFKDSGGKVMQAVDEFRTVPAVGKLGNSSDPLKAMHELNNFNLTHRDRSAPVSGGVCSPN